MTVIEFAIKFFELAQYAKHMTPTERDCIKRFYTYLVKPLYTIVVAKIDDFLSFFYDVDCVKMIKDKRRLIRPLGASRPKGSDDKPHGWSSSSGPLRKKKRFQGCSQLILLLLRLSY